MLLSDLAILKVIFIYLGQDTQELGRFIIKKKDCSRSIIIVPSAYTRK